MGKVKEQFLARLARDPVLRRQWELEEDRRLEPELPDSSWPQEGQDAQCQDGDTRYPYTHHSIFERSSDYATSLFVGR